MGSWARLFVDVDPAFIERASGEGHASCVLLRMRLSASGAECARAPQSADVWVPAANGSIVCGVRLVFAARSCAHIPFLEGLPEGCVRRLGYYREAWEPIQ